MNQIYIACLSVMLLFYSCNESFLNLNPESSSTEASFYKTEDHFNQAINAAYASMRTIINIGYIVGEMRSDNTHYTRNNNERMDSNSFREDVANFLVTSQNYTVSELWSGCYNTIAQANTILARLDATDLSDTFKNRIIGQAKFMRAWAYFELVQCYARIPIQLTEVKTADQAFPVQSTPEEVYAVIIDDVKDAIDKLETVEFPQDGSATKGAAKMLYAYVLMTKPSPDYSTAESQLDDVINKMGYDLLPHYADVFDTSKKNSVEHIFSVQYQMGNQGQESNWLYLFMPRTKEGELITGVEFSNTTSTGGWNVPTQAMIDSYEPNDLRLDPSVAIAVGTIENDALVVANVFKVGDPRINNYETALPFVNKYRHTHTNIFNTDDNWPVYRYSDALLLMAECLVDQNRGAEAVPFVNRVRTRAGLPSVSVVTADVVANERKHELAFENHRWFDLVRTGKAIDVMTADGAYIKSIDKDVSSRAYNVKKENLILPIPYRELRINKNLTQNPGSEPQ